MKFLRMEGRGVREAGLMACRINLEHSVGSLMPSFVWRSNPLHPLCAVAIPRDHGCPDLRFGWRASGMGHWNADYWVMWMHCLQQLISPCPSHPRRERENNSGGRRVSGCGLRAVAPPPAPLGPRFLRPLVTLALKSELIQSVGQQAKTTWQKSKRAREFHLIGTDTLEE